MNLACQQCGQTFTEEDLSIEEGTLGRPTLPNTLSDLPDIERVWVKCPKCGFIVEEEEEEE